ncbi:MAG: tetratricopeptide repeat protein [Bacteroidales bacterium]|nr:tetratricopeptide repeat protein [Bacteroidales bacterium]
MELLRQQQAMNQAKLDSISRATQKEMTKAARRDSIKNKILSQYTDTLAKLNDAQDRLTKSIIYSEIGEKFTEAGFPELSIEYFQKALMVEEDPDNLEVISEVYDGMGTALYKTGNFDNSIKTFEKSINVKQELGDKKGVSDALENIGTVYETTYDLDKAINYYERSIDLKDSIQDKKGMVKVIENIGDLYYKQKLLDKSIETLKKSAEISSQNKDSSSLGETYNKLGTALLEKGDFVEAEAYYLQSVQLKKDKGQDKEASLAINNLGNVSYNQQKYKKAIEYYEESLNIKEQEEYDHGKAVTLYNIGNTYKQLGRADDAITYFEQSKEVAKTENEDVYARSLKSLQNLYQQKNETQKLSAIKTEMALVSADKLDVDTEETVSEFKLYDKTSDENDVISLLTEEIQRQKKLYELESQKREKENKINTLRIQNKNEQIKRQQIILYSLIIVVLLIISLLVVLNRQYALKKRANAALTEKNNLITKQQKLITDNIVSASFIQRASLPPEEFLAKQLPNHFVLYKPKDIVSGDYYWADLVGNDLVVVVADCTGHGVSGALVSMLGISLFNEIVHKRGKKTVGEILDDVNKEVKRSLHQKDDDAEELREGMDLVMIKLDASRRLLEFSGANNPIYLVRNKEVIEYKGDRSPIGYWNKGKAFTTHKIELEPGDTFYMFSDGYVDQLSGETYKKFLSKRFKAMLTELNDLPLNEQKEIMDLRFTEWRGTYQQVDDVLVMGIKV